MIVVVNNSDDRTYEIGRAFAASHPDETILMNLSEGGKGNAVKRGVLEHASGDIIVFMDADNATPISEVERLLPYFEEGHDIVIGSRYTNPELVGKRQALYRVALGRLANRLIQLLAVPGIKDTQLGFKAFTSRDGARRRACAPPGLPGIARRSGQVKTQ